MQAGERGTAILEFPLAGIPIVLLLMIVFEMCLAMWSYHTLALAVKEGAIYASTKGEDCGYSPNNCQVTIAQIAQRIAATGVGIDPSQLGLTFTWTVSGTKQSESCYANNCPSTQCPGNAVPGSDYVQITAMYPAPIAIPALFWPGKSLSPMGAIELSASTYQIIQF